MDDLVSKLRNTNNKETQDQCTASILSDCSLSHMGDLSEEHGVLSEGRDLLSEERDVLSEKRDVLSEDHGVFSKERDVLSEDHGLFSKEHGVLSEDHGVFLKDHGVLSEERDVFPEAVLPPSSCIVDDNVRPISTLLESPMHKQKVNKTNVHKQSINIRSPIHKDSGHIRSPIHKQSAHILSPKRDIPSSPYEITSSQAQTPFQVMKMDFDMLRGIRSSEINIKHVLDHPGYRIEDRLYGLVRKKTVFSSAVTCVELIDESGTIGCSFLSSLVAEHNIEIGSIVVLEEFSLWKVGGNHINVVGRNVVEVYNGGVRQ